MTIIFFLNVDKVFKFVALLTKELRTRFHFFSSFLHPHAGRGWCRSEMSTVSIKRDGEGRVGLRFLRPNGASSGPFEIASLVPKGAAAQSRAVVVGDMFSAVNGQDVSALSDAAVAALFKGPPFSSLTLSLCAKAQSTSSQGELYEAARKGDSKKVAALLKAGAKPDALFRGIAISRGMRIPAY